MIVFWGGGAARLGNQKMKGVCNNPNVNTKIELGVVPVCDELTYEKLPCSSCQITPDILSVITTSKLIKSIRVLIPAIIITKTLTFPSAGQHRACIRRRESNTQSLSGQLTEHFLSLALQSYSLTIIPNSV